MWEFVRGPLVWIAFAVLIFGSLTRIVLMIRQAKKEKVVLPTMSAKHGARRTVCPATGGAVVTALRSGPLSVQMATPESWANPTMLD